MSDTHLVESLQVELEFENSPGAPSQEAFQQRLADFMRGPALQIVDLAFETARVPGEVWRLERLDIDLGRIVVDGGQAWEARWSQALRERLARTLGELREGPPGDSGAPRLLRRRQARLDLLLYFLRHGHLPWYGRSGHAAGSDDPHEIGRQLLRDDPRGLAGALRGASDRRPLLARLAAQFDDAWLAQLLQALLPDQPALAARLAEAVPRGSQPGRAGGHVRLARLWEAALAEALVPGAGAVAPDVTVMRLQLRLALAEPATGGDDDPLVAIAPAWRRLLREDRVWLKSTLQRQGRSQPLERRLARLLPTDVLAELASLWLASEQTVAVAGWIRAVADRAAPAFTLEQDTRRELWKAALVHLWGGGGDANFDRRRFVREVRERAGLADSRPARAARRGATAFAFDAETPQPPDPLHADAAWEPAPAALPADFQRALQRELRRGEAGYRRLARDWPAQHLLAAACLRWPQGRLLMAAAISSPPHDRATQQRRWACTLRHLHDAAPAARIDEASYLDALVRDAASHDDCPPGESAQRWCALTREDADAAPWVERIVALAAPNPAMAGKGVVPPAPAALTRGAQAILATAPKPAPPPAPADNPLPPPGERAAPRPGSEDPASGDAQDLATQTATARRFAGRVSDALASLASSIGRRIGRLFSSSTASASDLDPSRSIDVGNAGLVLLGSYLPRLFEALSLTEGNAFDDEAARERAVHLLQFAVDGADETAPESRLVLNKLLCGLVPGAPIDRRFRATATERALVESLLEGVIAHWTILGSTTVDGLRQTFLQRRGRLETRDGGGRWLVVEAGSFDMLIDHLPWGYTMQKLPWMEEVLNVEWR